MIFYYSGTGNSRHVANCIGSETNEEVMNIAECMQNGSFEFTLKADERLGFVLPTYFYGMPLFVEEFMKKISVKMPENSAPYVFFVATCGNTTGQIGGFVKAALKARSIDVDAMFTVVMPDTWTPMFNLTNKEKVAAINKAADQSIAEIAKKVKERSKVMELRHVWPMIMVKMVRSMYPSSSKTSRFTVESSCIGCGLCAKNCPEQAIEIRDKRPVWVHDTCSVCLGCLHRCPKFAIQYGKNTKKHGQYVHP